MTQQQGTEQTTDYYPAFPSIVLPNVAQLETTVQGGAHSGVCYLGYNL